MVNTIAANTKLENGVRVQLFVNVSGTAITWEIQTGTIVSRDSVGSYNVLLDGDRLPVLAHRTQFTVLPKTEYLSTEERKVVSARKLTLKSQAINACNERECRTGFTCAKHREV